MSPPRSPKRIKLMSGFLRVPNKDYRCKLCCKDLLRVMDVNFTTGAMRHINGTTQITETEDPRSSEKGDSLRSST